MGEISITVETSQDVIDEVLDFLDEYEGGRSPFSEQVCQVSSVSRNCQFGPKLVQSKWRSKSKS